MKRIACCFLSILIFLSINYTQVNAQTIVDTTGMDFQNYWYTGTFGQQIVVDSIGTVHVCYTKTWCTETDTGYQVMYANVTDGRKNPIPSQLPQKPVQPGVVYMDGGHNGTPIYFYYGVGGKINSFTIGDQHWMSWAKLSENGDSVIPLTYYYSVDYCGGCTNKYYNTINMEVNNTTGIVHSIFTWADGNTVSYIQCDNLIPMNDDIPFSLNMIAKKDYEYGKVVPKRYMRNLTKGADISVSQDGKEVTVATLHQATNILLHKGTYGGNLWEDDFYEGLSNGSVIALFDTTNSETGENIPNNDPKPYTEVQVCYDEGGNLHVVYDAVYQDIFIDTTESIPWNDWPGWWSTFSSIAGDTNGVFYDGSEHPKPQLRYWNSITKTHSLIAECKYPLPGETYKWYNYGIIDSGAATWGKFINDGPIANIEFLINNDRKDGEPLMICVWEEMQGDVTPLFDSDNVFGYTYYSYMKDIKISVSNDGFSWSEPYNITNTPNKDEGEVSVYRDVIDNKIHLVYSEDKLPGSDYNLRFVDDYEDQYIKNWPKIENHLFVPIRKETTDQVLIVYREFDLSLLPTGIKSNNNNTEKYQLAQNYPNPFNPSTTLSYSIPKRGMVELKVYDVLGREVVTLVNEEQQAGSYEVKFDARDLTSGIYIYRLQAGDFIKTKKLMLIK